MFDLQHHAERLKQAIAAAMEGVEIDADLGPDAAALSFVHPVHQATCIMVVEPDAQVGVALLLAVIIGDWDQLRSNADGAGLFALNPRLLTCAVGLLPINEDEIAAVLCRRMPADAIEAAEAVGMLDDMIWEYAQVTGGAMSETAPVPTPAPIDRGPRLIHSLDEV